MSANKTETITTRPNTALGGPIRPTANWPVGRAATLIDLWNAGHAAAEIAARLGVGVGAVESKLHKLRTAGRHLVRRRAGPARHTRRTGRARRRCLHCGEMFASDHPGNRLCPVCLDEGPFTSALV